MAERLLLEELEIVYVDTGGNGPAVVLVHGLGGSFYAWRAQMSACAERGYRAIAYDQRGAGLSSRPPGPYSVEDWAADVVALLDELGVDRAALVGHSVGCTVVEHAALALGERCWAVAMLGGMPEWPPEASEVFEQRAELARAGRMEEIAEAVGATGLSERCRAERPEMHGLFLRMIAGNDPEGYAESALATGRAKMLEPERITCPALAFAGELDPVTPPEASEAIAAAIPGCETAAIAGAAHWCQIEAPAAVNEALLSFLDWAWPDGQPPPSPAARLVGD